MKDKVPEGDYLEVDAFPVWNGKRKKIKERKKVRDRNAKQKRPPREGG